MTNHTSSSVTDLLSQLIQLDTTTTGDYDGPGERAAAEFAAERLTDAGLSPEIFEAAPQRSNVVTRWSGTDSSRPPLLVQGHLDVVPAEARDWSVPPFSGEVRDGFVWGRGAIDMKQFIAQHSKEVYDRRAPFAAPKAIKLKALARIKPSKAEVAGNPRSRSAILRVAERTSEGI